jgi:integrase
MADLLQEENINVPTVQAFMLRWLEHQKSSVKEGTWKAYQSMVFHFLQKHGQERLNSITRETILNYRDSLKHLRSRTVNLHIGLIELILKEAVQQDILTKNPAELKNLRVRDAVTKGVFTVEQLQKILGASNPEWKSMVLFGLYTGSRLQDIALMKCQR